MTTAEHLAALQAQCPECNGDLRAEPDHRWPSRWAGYCPRPDCTENGGCWPVSLGELRQAERAANYQFKPA